MQFYQDHSRETSYKTELQIVTQQVKYYEILLVRL
jgi:hypothetical protein